jgi:molybdopterin/thiamine biosynthesis adenylyltransferase
MSDPHERGDSLQREMAKRLIESGLLHESRMLDDGDAWARGRGVITGVTGHVDVANRRLRLSIGFTAAFPRALPEIAVHGIELPHVDRDGKLCFMPDSDVLLDVKQPWAIVAEALRRARSTLELSLSHRSAEYAQEIIAHWHRLARRMIDCIVGASDEPHRTNALFLNGKLHAVADDLSVYASSLPGRSLLSLKRRNAVYIPIDPAADPSFIPRELATLAGMRRHIAALPPPSVERIREILRCCNTTEELVAFGVDRRNGTRGIVGARLKDIRGGRHPLLDSKATAKVEAVDLALRDESYLRCRGGVLDDYSSSRVVIAGCGSVGGYIALLLARAGVSRLTLVDPDSFELGNTYRHACGLAGQRGQKKVDALKSEIERLVPYVIVEAVPERIESFLGARDELLSQHDLVIAATGAPMTELHLNELIWSAKANPPMVVAWLEPLGLGGHILITHVPEQHGNGCFECLFDRPVEGGPIVNRASFASPDAVYTRDLLGCGGPHLPFADLDAQRTAECTSRLALRVLRREIDSARLISWKGDVRPFESAGYSVTPRYRTNGDHLESGGDAFGRRTCPRCGGHS